MTNKPGLHLIVNCQQCGKEYCQARSDQQYCSKRCAHTAWRAVNYPYVMSISLSCAHCGERFTRLHGTQTYCSGACRDAAEKVRRKLNNSGVGKGGARRGKRFVKNNKLCGECGKPFYAPPAQLRKGSGKFCSKPCHDKYVSTHPERFPHTRTKRAKVGKRDDIGIFVRSSWEANWARYLNWLLQMGEILSWEYEVDTYEFPVKRGSKFYTPDFKVVDKNGKTYYDEVKGYMDQKSSTKLKRMSKYFPEVEVRLIDKVAYYAVSRQVESLIPNWEKGSR